MEDAGLVFTVVLGGVLEGVRFVLTPSSACLRRFDLISPPLPVVTLVLLPLVFEREEEEVGLGVSFAEAVDRVDLLLEEVLRLRSVLDFLRGSLLLGIVKFNSYDYLANRHE